MNEVRLTEKERAIFNCLKAKAGHVVTRGELHAAYFGPNTPDSESNVIDVYIGYLRGKLGKSDIETVRGQGYKYVPQPITGSPFRSAGSAGQVDNESLGARI
jgi:DNA-binding response OmpR family regulator